MLKRCHLLLSLPSLQKESDLTSSTESSCNFLNQLESSLSFNIYIMRPVPLLGKHAKKKKKMFFVIFSVCPLGSHDNH